MNYDEIVDALMVVASIPLNSEDSNFTRVLPATFLYADSRIYSELSFLATDVTTQVPLVALERDTLLAPDTLTVRSLGICMPPGTPTRNNRRFYPERVSPEALEMFWPQPNFRPGVPQKYAIIGVRSQLPPVPSPIPPTTQPLPPVFQPEQFTYVLRLMPSPDRPYVAELFGAVRPKLLSPINPETFLSVNYPELFIACCMVFITGYQRDYGAQADDPQRAMSWTAQYTALRDGIMLRSGMMKGEGAGYTALAPAPIAQQPRAP